MSEPLQPLSLGEILDRTTQLYRHNFLLFVKVAAVPGLVIAASNAAMVAILTTVRSGAFQRSQSGLLLLANYLLVMPVLFMAVAFSHAVLTRTAARIYVGGVATFLDSMRETWRGLGRLVWLLIQQVFFAFVLPGLVAVALAILAGAIGAAFWAGQAGKVAVGSALILLCAAYFTIVMWLLARYSLAVASCVLEGRTARESMKRAIRLSDKRRGGICLLFLFGLALSCTLVGTQLVFGRLLVAAGMMVADPTGAQSVAHQFGRFLLSFVGQVLFPPVVAIALTIFYFDQRVRKEGYDIELMMQAAGLSPVSESSALEEA